MRNLEPFEESCEYFLLPQRVFKTFTATIYETDQIFQDVVCYPLHLDGEVLDVEIRIPIYVKPSAIRDDIAASLYAEYRLTLGNLKFELCPQNHEIELDNGDKGQVGTKEKNPAKLNPGQEITYQLESTPRGKLQAKMKTIIITRIAAYMWQATIEDWDLGHPIALGESIPEAIDQLIEDYSERKEPIINYKWK